MEKNADNLLNLSKLLTEIQQEIASYLDAPSLSFFAQSNKQILKNILPSLRSYQALFPLQLTAKWRHTYLYQANQLFVRENNDQAQLTGNTHKRTAFMKAPLMEENGRIEQVTAGEYHTFVLTKDNRLWVSGSDKYGQLGLIDKQYRNPFIAVSWPIKRGKVQQVIAGAYHTLVLTDDKQLWGCGYNIYGQLGLGDKENRATFTKVKWPKERGTIQKVMAGMHNTFVLTDDNQLWGSGYNKYGELGLGDKEDRVIFTKIKWPEERGKIEQVIVGGNHIFVLTQDKRLWGCGYNGYGQLGLKDYHDRSSFVAVPWSEQQGKIQQMMTGGAHTAVLTENTLWMCGFNRYGQLGLGDQADRNTFTAIPWPAERGKIQQMAVGGYHTFMLSDDNRLWACGYNVNGELALCDNQSRLTFTPVTALPPTMYQLLILNSYLKQLIELGTILTRTSNTEMAAHSSQCQEDGSSVIRYR